MNGIFGIFQNSADTGKRSMRFTLIELPACQGEAQRATVSGETMRRRKRSKAFTLIELLVVIVIIAILASLLLPALARAKYQALNVVCIGNQKQLAGGITMYAGDNEGFYPTTSNPDMDCAPDLVIWGGYNYPRDLRPYFAGDLKGTWTCPLAPEIFQRGGGTWWGMTGSVWGKTVDLDNPATTGALTTYSHFYGRVKGLGTPGYRTAANTEAFRPERPMLKIGQPFEDNSSAGIIESNVLLTDSLWIWNSGIFAYTHRPYGGEKLGPARGFNLNGDGFGRYRTWIQNDPEYGSQAYLFLNNPMNYTLDDGSVHHLPGIKYRDPRVILVGNWSNNWYSGHVIPRPE